MIQQALSQYAEDYFGTGFCFKFLPTSDINVARNNLKNPATLNNISWAFYVGPVVTAMYALPPAAPTLHTKRINSYTRSNNLLEGEALEFFERD